MHSFERSCTCAAGHFISWKSELRLAARLAAGFLNSWLPSCCACRLQWARGQPDGAFGGEDCGDLRTMSKFIGLNDFNCSARTQWICEKSLW